MAENEEPEEYTTFEKAFIEGIRQGGIDKYFKNAKDIRKEQIEQFNKVFPKLLWTIIGLYLTIFYLVVIDKMSPDFLIGLISTVVGVVGTLFIQSKRTF
ncbi:MAG: hypothetical protein IH840_08995 [Candidatus Heimdallarchaeota archaeon]|nr:hypothetical protein [Candidatus Heimdallarchaeota archaeon]